MSLDRRAGHPSDDRIEARDFDPSKPKARPPDQDLRAKRRVPAKVHDLRPSQRAVPVRANAFLRPVVRGMSRAGLPEEGGHKKERKGTKKNQEQWVE
jgi:hypothetical protein